MSPDTLTTTAGIGGFASLLLQAAIQSGFISPQFAPIATTGAGLAIAIIGYFTAKNRSQSV